MNKYLKCVSAALSINLAIGAPVAFATAPEVSVSGVLAACTYLVLQSTPTAISAIVADQLLNKQLNN